MSEAKDLALAELKANIRKAEAQATLAEVEAYEAVARSEKRERKEKSAKAEAQKDRVYRFDSEVSKDTVSKAINQLQEWHQKNPKCGIRFVITSPGGEVDCGMALFDELVSLSIRGGGAHHVTTVARGCAASMGGILLQAGDTRLAGARSLILIHEISAGAWGSTSHIEDVAKFLRKECKRVTRIFLDRSEGKCSPALFTKSWRKSDWWLESSEALALGFIDGIG